MPGSREPSSVLDVMFRQLGVRKALKLGTFMAAWALADQARAHADEPMRAVDYAAYWRENIATTQRSLVLFHQVFRNDWTPSDLFARIEAERGEQLDRASLGVWAALPASLVS